MSLSTDLWDTWCLIRYGVPVTFTKNERGKLNAAIAQWVAVSATPAILKEKYAAYLKMFPDLPLPTPTAIASHWNALNGQTHFTRQTESSIILAACKQRGIQTLGKSRDELLKRLNQ